jgi:hypothetical protein
MPLGHVISLTVATVDGVSTLKDYLKLDSCGGYPTNYTSVQEQYREYAAMRDALNATGRPIYYSICEIGGVVQSPVVLNSPSSCGREQAYTSLEWMSAKLDVKALANSVCLQSCCCAFLSWLLVHSSKLLLCFLVDRYHADPPPHPPPSNNGTDGTHVNRC